MEQPRSKKFQVYGELIIPFYFATEGESKQQAYDRVRLILNKKNIKLIDADIHTSDGNSHPLIAPDCNVRLIEVIGDGDI